MKNATKCLVTGGAGFIGSHLCDRLISRGFEVFCIDNLITGSEKNISHLLQNKLFHFIFHDVVQKLPNELINGFKHLRYIYHLASPASPPQYQKYPIETLLVNSAGTHNLLELSVSIGGKFLLASTSEVYGNPLEHPQKETYYGNVNPVGLRSCYDEGKRFAEALTMEFIRKKKINGSIIRIFNTYGPRMQINDGRVVSNFIYQALHGKFLTIYGDGSQTRSFCFIDDMVKGIIDTMETSLTDSEVINLGNPQEYTILQIGEHILRLTKSKAKLLSTQKLPSDDPVMRKPDITKAKKLVGWEPKVSLDAGLIKTIEYFKIK